MLLSDFAYVLPMLLSIGREEGTRKYGEKGGVGEKEMCPVSEYPRVLRRPPPPVSTSD
jgi:hypothetical protein